ncbi:MULTISPECIES: dTDP-4-dehydrorhamnose reductase [Paenibacillus]|uniref:dTDP-4-dehydrorhamnose reductase n=1 Tax=Paenibacillus TaxID=44249 RepID=UPI000377CE38|nr:MULTISPECIES: dTDP-4-dehydrorhamnose reductase [Paenibacillus]
MKVLVTGASGQLGIDTVAVLERKGHTVMACDRTKLDITNQQQCQQVISSFHPEVVIHCAAYTAVDAAESDIDSAYKVNAIGSRNVTVAAEAIQAKVIYISTDYVFDGKSTASYHEYDTTDPQGIYGKSKRAGEVLTQTLSSRYFIVRTSWVYGMHGSNFVKTMLKLGQEKPELKVVNDQKGSPTYTVDLAEFLSELMLTEKYGIYHASNSEACTWYEFTGEIFKQAKDILGITITAKLEPCTTADFPRPAPRPINSTMEHLSIRTNGFEDIRSWQEGLTAFLLEYKQNLS